MKQEQQAKPKKTDYIVTVECPLNRIDFHMLTDKQKDGYWKRAKASAMDAQLQQNGRES